MIVIKHLSGRLRGEEQSISDECKRITFGRAESCDVVFPPEETVVGREHFALVRKTKEDWSIDLLGDRYVEVNGVQAQSAQPLPKDAKLRLGTEKGPSFKVIIEPAVKKLGATTAPQKKPPPLPVRLRQHARAGIAAFLVLLVAGLGWAYYDHVTKEEAASQRAALLEGQDRIKKEQDKAASERISAEDQQKLARAAFLVMGQRKDGVRKGVGTAWPVGPSLLATNAHVAELRPEFLEEGTKMLVRAPGPEGPVFEVVKAEMHPGYLRFPAYVLEKDIVTMEPWGASPVSANLVYDIGLLHIDGEVSPDAILEIAPVEELRNLTAGTPLARAGYPMEDVTGGHLQDLAPRPELHFGRLSSFTDVFGLPTDDTDQRLMVYHSIASAGGSSGSPIIGPSGQVVAVLNAGNLFSIMTEAATKDIRCQVKVDWEKEEISPPPSWCYTRVPSAVMINIAQRADMVIDLIEGRAEEALADDQAYWEKQLAILEQGDVDRLIAAALEAITPPQEGATLELISEERGVLSEANAEARGEGRNRIKGHKVTLEAGVPMVFLVYSERHQPLWLFYQGEDLGIKASNKTGTTTPMISYTTDTEETGYIAVQGPDVDTPYIFRIYKWKAAES